MYLAATRRWARRPVRGLLFRPLSTGAERLALDAGEHLWVSQLPPKHQELLEELRAPIRRSWSETLSQTDARGAASAAHRLAQAGLPIPPSLVGELYHSLVRLLKSTDQGSNVLPIVSLLQSVPFRPEAARRLCAELISLVLHVNPLHVADIVAVLLDAPIANDPSLAASVWLEAAGQCLGKRHMKQVTEILALPGATKSLELAGPSDGWPTAMRQLAVAVNAERNRLLGLADGTLFGSSSRGGVSEPKRPDDLLSRLEAAALRPTRTSPESPASVAELEEAATALAAAFSEGLEMLCAGEGTQQSVKDRALWEAFRSEVSLERRIVAKGSMAHIPPQVAAALQRGSVAEHLPLAAIAWHSCENPTAPWSDEERRAIQRLSSVPAALSLTDTRCSMPSRLRISTPEGAAAVVPKMIGTPDGEDVLAVLIREALEVEDWKSFTRYLRTVGACVRKSPVVEVCIRNKLRKQPPVAQSSLEYSAATACPPLGAADVEWLAIPRHTTEAGALRVMSLVALDLVAFRHGSTRAATEFVEGLRFLMQEGLPVGEETWTLALQAAMQRGAGRDVAFAVAERALVSATGDVTSSLVEDPRKAAEVKFRWPPAGFSVPYLFSADALYISALRAFAPHALQGVYAGLGIGSSSRHRPEQDAIASGEGPCPRDADTPLMAPESVSFARAASSAIHEFLEMSRSRLAPAMSSASLASDLVWAASIVLWRAGTMSYGRESIENTRHEIDTEFQRLAKLSARGRINDPSLRALTGAISGLLALGDAAGAAVTLELCTKLGIPMEPSMWKAAAALAAQRDARAVLTRILQTGGSVFSDRTVRPRGPTERPVLDIEEALASGSYTRFYLPASGLDSSPRHEWHEFFNPTQLLTLAESATKRAMNIAALLFEHAAEMAAIDPSEPPAIAAPASDASPTDGLLFRPLRPTDRSLPVPGPDGRTWSNFFVATGLTKASLRTLLKSTLASTANGATVKVDALLEGLEKGWMPSPRQIVPGSVDADAQRITLQAAVEELNNLFPPAMRVTIRPSDVSPMHGVTGALRLQARHFSRVFGGHLER
jgi:hypothetical protein